jgi:hypothetical protein
MMTVVATPEIRLAEDPWPVGPEVGAEVPHTKEATCSDG